MLNTIIIEDERPARENLIQALTRVSPEVKIIATLSTVKEGIDYLTTSCTADIIFSDVQLPDGLSFGIFRHAQVQVPVIFITGFDEFMMNAFEYNGIDYLLKPVDEKELEKALQKYKMLQNHFTSKAAELSRLLGYTDSRKKSRMVVKKGMENIALQLDNIVLFYTENKVVYVIDRTGKKYLSDKNLGELEEELDENRFFRANRQYIINIDYVKGFKSFEKVKLLVDLMVSEINHSIIISQETAPAFRKWVYEA
jgi:DNA-binding LytR/AlgR family response regulator